MGASWTVLLFLFFLFFLLHSSCLYHLKQLNGSFGIGGVKEVLLFSHVLSAYANSHVLFSILLGGFAIFAYSVSMYTQIALIQGFPYTPLTPSTSPKF